jgi:hypothetical protein
MSKLTEKYWPQWSRKNRAFLSEDQIVIDLITKIRGSRSALTWWTLIEKEDINRYNASNKNKIASYYNLASSRNPYFSNVKESLDVMQLRILTKVWEYLNRDLYNDHIESPENRSDK